MQIPSQDDDLMERWQKCTMRQKSVLIKRFLDEYGENATWEQWHEFLQRHKVKAFNWSKCD